MNSEKFIITEPFLLQLALYAVILISVVSVCFTIVGSIAFWRTSKGAAATFSKLFERSDALRMVTVIMIVALTALLAILDRLPPGAVAILSGIAGFVLGGAGGLTRTKQPDDASSPE